METIVQPTFNALFLDPTPGTPCFIHILTLLNSLKTTSSKNHLKEITSVYYTVSSEKCPTWDPRVPKQYFFFWRARYNKSGKRSPHDNKKRKEGSEKSEDSSLLQYKALLICRWESCLCVWNPRKISALSCFSACLNDTIQVHYTAEEGGNRFTWDGMGFFSRNFPTSWPRSTRLCHGTYSKADIPEDSKYTFWTRRLGIQFGQ